MKKSFFSIALIFVACNFTFGQRILSTSAQQMVCSARLEVIGGLNTAKTSMQNLSDSESNKLKAGFHLGFRVPMYLGKDFHLVPGLMFEQKGTQYEYRYEDTASPSEFTGGIDRSVRLSYITLPVQINYSPFKRHTEFKLIGGLNPSYLAGRNATVNSFGNERETRGTDDLNRFDLALSIGLSYQAFDKIGVGLTYDHGLLNIYPQASEESFNRTLRMGLFYRLNFNPLFKESYTKKRKLLDLDW